MPRSPSVLRDVLEVSLRLGLSSAVTCLQWWAPGADARSTATGEFHNEASLFRIQSLHAIGLRAHSRPAQTVYEKTEPSQFVLVWRLEKHSRRYHCCVNRCVTKWKTSSDLSVSWHMIALHVLNQQMGSSGMMMYTKAVVMWHLTTVRNLAETQRPPGMLLRPP